jgi:signal transduction histidine kinase
VQLLERLARRVEDGADVALALVLAAALAFDAARAAILSGQWPYAVGVGGVVAVIALLRARNRAWAAVLALTVLAMAAAVSVAWAIIPGQLQAAPLVGLVVLAASAARWLPPRQAVIIAAVGMFVIAAAESSHAGGSFNPRALFALFGATVWAAGLSVGVWLRYLDHRRESAIDAIRRDERLELARELHDVVAHHVTGIVVQAQAARFADRDHAAPLAAALASIETAGLDTLTAIRRLVGLLRDAGDTSGAGAPEPIGLLVERFTRHGPAVDLRIPANLTSGGWPPEVAGTVYRIVQEALTNVARHAAGARSVTVTITDDPEQVTVEVTDDAPTRVRSARAASGYGLVGMRERVEALGGKLNAGPRPGDAGWAVQASVPVPARARP